MTNDSAPDPTSDPAINPSVELPDPSDDSDPSGWTSVAPATNPAWMATPPPGSTSPKPKGASIAVGVALLVIGIGLLAYGVPAVILHVRAAMGDGWPPEGNFLRAAFAFGGVFVTFVGTAVLAGAIRGKRS